MFLNDENQAKWQMPITFGYFFSMVCLGFVGGAWGPSMTRLSELTGSSASQIGSLFIFLCLGFVIASLTIARLFDKLPGNRVIACGILLLAISLACLGRVTSVWMLFGLAMVIGFANGMIDLGCNTLLPWLIKEKCEPYFNMIHVCYALGGITTPTILSRALRTSNDISHVLTILGAVMLPFALYIMLLPSPRIPLTTDKKVESNTKANKRVWQLVGLFGVFFFLLMGSQAMFSTWISTVVLNYGIANESQAALMSSVIWAGTICGRLLSTWLSSRVRPQFVVIGGLSLSVIAGLLLLSAQKNITLITIGVFLSGLAIGPMFANGMMLLKDKALLSGKLNGLIFASNQVGGMLIPWAFGIVTNAKSYRAFTLVVSVGLFLSLLTILLIQRIFPRPLEEELEI